MSTTVSDLEDWLQFAKAILDKFNILSVNQLNAQIKISDIWKAVNVDNYPTKVILRTVNNDSAMTRSIVNGKLVETGKCALTQATFINDAIKAWNKSNEDVKQSLTYNVAKKKH